MGFAVLHIEKGTPGKAAGLGSHIDRTKRVLNADPNLSSRNFYIRTTTDGNFSITAQKENKSLQERINERILAGYKGKTAIRKDAITHLDIILSGSHEDMKRIATSPGKLKEWALENAKFIGDKFGHKNIVEFSCHVDERTPHIHCVVIPLTKDGRLSAKEMIGDRRKLSGLQDVYGNLMDEKFGLQRGLKGSTATHDSVREYYARINQRMIEPGHISIPLALEPPKISVPPIVGRKKWAEKQNKAILDTFVSLTEKTKSFAEKVCKIEIKDAYTAKLQAEEHLDRMRKQNAQLKGHLKHLVQTIHPEKQKSTSYVTENSL